MIRILDSHDLNTQSFIRISVTMITADLIFHILSFGPVFGPSLFRILAFGFAQAVIFASLFSLFPAKVQRILTVILCWGITLLAFFSLFQFMSSE